MSFPQVTSVTGTAFDTEDTSRDVSMPATVNAGELLVMLLSFGFAGGTLTTPDGWTLLFNNTNGTSVRGAAFAKVADGTEGGTTVTVETSASTQAVAQVYRITDWLGSTDGVEAGTVATGDDEFPDPASLSPSWGSEDALWLAMEASQSDNAVSSYPSDYTDGAYHESTVIGSACSLGSARRALAASSENPGSFTLENTYPWVANVVVVRPAGIQSSGQGETVVVEHATEDWGDPVTSSIFD